MFTTNPVKIAEKYARDKKNLKDSFVTKLVDYISRQKVRVLDLTEVIGDLEESKTEAEKAIEDTLNILDEEK